MSDDPNAAPPTDPPPTDPPPTDPPPTDPPSDPPPTDPPSDPPPTDPPSDPPPYWPDDWREKMAEHQSAGDKKAYERELRRLQRVTDPAAIYGSFRENEARWDQGGLIKLPGDDASDEEVAAYHKAIGVPEEANGYLDDLKLENGAEIGELDKPIVDSFATAAHEAGVTPQAFKKMLDWYYKGQEDFAADLDQKDHDNKVNTDKALREEFGARFSNLVNSASVLFAQAPGGSDVNNEQSLIARLYGGRMADGTIIGNDAAFNKWIIGLTQEYHPQVTVVESGDEGGKSVDERLKEIAKFRKENRRAYDKDEELQAEERRLLDAQMRMRERK